MPSRPQLLSSTSPPQSTNAVDQVVSAISRKLTTSQNTTPTTAPTPKSGLRRPSFSMDGVFHKKDKKHEQSKAREDGRSEKRLSMVLGSKERNSSPAPRAGPVKPGKFELVVDSPPLVMHGTVTNSTGALFGGRLKLLVEDPSGKVTVKKMTWALRGTVVTKKPVGKECKECTEKHETIESESVITEPRVFKKGEDNQFPVTFLLKGHLPATTHSQLGSLTYAFVATATTDNNQTFDIVHPITVQRAIPEGPNKASIRIFPPTNLTGRVVLPPVVHPIGTFPVQMTLSGVVEKKGESFLRWRLRKMMWRIEEHSKVISIPCPKHHAKVSNGKAIQHTETRTLGSEDTKTGWKTDFDTAGGEIYMEFDASIATKASHKPCCDVESPAGLEVKHNLVIELIVAEEFVPERNPHLITPTGAARVLRMQFALHVTERGGMGISWDEEMPPMYEDVPPSPPGYGSADKNDGAFGGAIMEDYNGPPLEYTELERMHTENPADPPVYIERDRATQADSLMRPRPSRRYDVDAVPAGPSSRTFGFTSDELNMEPPQYALRQRDNSNDSQAPIEEEYGQGEAADALGS